MQAYVSAADSCPHTPVRVVSIITIISLKGCAMRSLLAIAFVSIAPSSAGCIGFADTFTYPWVVSGTVVDETTSEPIDGGTVQVCLVSAGQESACADPAQIQGEGSFEVSIFGPGSCGCSFFFPIPISFGCACYRDVDPDAVSVVVQTLDDATGSQTLDVADDDIEIRPASLGEEGVLDLGVVPMSI
jgi:hypothetical protein